MMKKLFVLLIKYMPTIQLVGMLVNNTLYKKVYSHIGNFWFKDEDAGTGKVWNYFKEI